MIDRAPRTHCHLISLYFPCIILIFLFLIFPVLFFSILALAFHTCLYFLSLHLSIPLSRFPFSLSMSSHFVGKIFVTFRACIPCGRRRRVACPPGRRPGRTRSPLFSSQRSTKPFSAFWHRSDLRAALCPLRRSLCLNVFMKYKIILIVWKVVCLIKFFIITSKSKDRWNSLCLTFENNGRFWLENAFTLLRSMGH